MAHRSKTWAPSTLNTPFAPVKTNGKYIWRSTDGGKPFDKVVAHLLNNDLIITIACT